MNLQIRFNMLWILVMVHLLMRSNYAILYGNQYIIEGAMLWKSSFFSFTLNVVPPKLYFRFPESKMLVKGVYFPIDIRSQNAELTDGRQQYIFGIPETYDANTRVTLYIGTENTATIRIQAPFARMDITKVIHNTVQAISLDSRLQISGSTLVKKGIHVSSTSDITLYVHIEDLPPSASGDVFLAKPINHDSEEFYVFTYRSHTRRNQFLVSVPFDGTEITILVKCFSGSVQFEGNFYSNGDSIRRMLNRFDTIQLQSLGDMTGTFLNASKPISVLSGNKCLSINGACDFVIDQIDPVADWKDQYIASLPMNYGSALVRVIASRDDTKLSINGNFIASMRKGQIYDKTLQRENIHLIEANFPVGVVEILDMNHDPFMVNLPSIDQFETNYIFQVPTGFGENYIIIYVETDKADGIILDNNPVTLNNLKTIRPSGKHVSYSTGRILVGAGVHRLTHAKQGTRFGVMLFGLDSSVSYGFYLCHKNGPSCNPACDNNGTCVAENVCHCGLGYYGKHCENGNGIPNELKPTLHASIQGTETDFMNPLSWYSAIPISENNKVCYVKLLIKNASQDTVVIAKSSTTDGHSYGNYTVGPIDSAASITGKTRFACLEVRCPFVTTNGDFEDTVVDISLRGTNESLCGFSDHNIRLTNFTIQSSVGQPDSAQFVLELGNNYGPYYGVYMAIGDRNKAKYIAEHKCYSGREYDYDSYNPDIGVLAEFSC